MELEYIMHKKGQTLFMAIIFAVAIYMFGMLFINFLMPEVTTFRVDMGCSDISISDGAKLTCLIGDIAIPYGIWLIISTAGGLILARLVL